MAKEQNEIKENAGIAPEGTLEITEEQYLEQLSEQHRIRIEKLNQLKADGKNPCSAGREAGGRRRFGGAAWGAKGAAAGAADRPPA